MDIYGSEVVEGPDDGSLSLYPVGAEPARTLLMVVLYFHPLFTTTH